MLIKIENEKLIYCEAFIYNELFILSLIKF